MVFQAGKGEAFNAGHDNNPIRPMETPANGPK